MTQKKIWTPSSVGRMHLRTGHVCSGTERWRTAQRDFESVTMEVMLSSVSGRIADKKCKQLEYKIRVLSMC